MAMYQERIAISKYRGETGRSIAIDNLIGNDPRTYAMVLSSGWSNIVCCHLEKYPHINSHELPGVNTNVSRALTVSSPNDIVEKACALTAGRSHRRRHGRAGGEVSGFALLVILEHVIYASGREQQHALCRGYHILGSD